MVRLYATPFNTRPMAQEIRICWPYSGKSPVASTRRPSAIRNRPGGDSWTLKNGMTSMMTITKNTRMKMKNNQPFFLMEPMAYHTVRTLKVIIHDEDSGTGPGLWSQEGGGGGAAPSRFVCSPTVPKGRGELAEGQPEGTLQGRGQGASGVGVREGGTLCRHCHPGDHLPGFLVLQRVIRQRKHYKDIMT